MVELVEIILGAGAIAGATTAIIVALVLIIKPIRKCLLKAFGTNKAQLAILRSDITYIYYKFLPNRTLPTYIRENLILLNEAYVEAGGNSYINAIVKDMMSWDISNV